MEAPSPIIEHLSLAIGGCGQLAPSAAADLRGRSAGQLSKCPGGGREWLRETSLAATGRVIFHTLVHCQASPRLLARLPMLGVLPSLNMSTVSRESNSGQGFGDKIITPERGLRASDLLCRRAFCLRHVIAGNAGFRATVCHTKVIHPKVTKCGVNCGTVDSPL